MIEKKTEIRVGEINVEITLREDFKRFERVLSEMRKKALIFQTAITMNLQETELCHKSRKKKKFFIKRS